MCNGKRKISLGFSDDEATEGLHICYIYRDEDERRQVIAKFHEHGLYDREKGLCLVDSVSPAEMSECLIDAGVDRDMLERQLEVRDALHTYCPGEAFSAKEMLEKLGMLYRSAIDEGYSGARITGEMSWFLKSGKSRERELLEYEARVNILARELPFNACCQYNASLFSGRMLMDVLSLHPAMIIRGRLFSNPYYMEPEEFIKSLDE